MICFEHSESFIGWACSGFALQNADSTVRNGSCVLAKSMDRLLSQCNLKQEISPTGGGGVGAVTHTHMEHKAENAT